jgi:hypothetical protein
MQREMIMRNTAHAFVLCAILLAGCSSKTVPSVNHTPVKQRPLAVSNQPTSFLYGDGRIEVGQSKSWVVEEIRKSVRKWHDKTLTVSTPKNTKENRWVLSYGSGGGAAPGSGTLILVFKNNLLVSLKHHPHR